MICLVAAKWHKVSLWPWDLCQFCTLRNLRKSLVAFSLSLSVGNLLKRILFWVRRHGDQGFESLENFSRYCWMSCRRLLMLGRQVEWTDKLMTARVTQTCATRSLLRDTALLDSNIDSRWNILWSWTRNQTILRSHYFERQSWQKGRRSAINTRDVFRLG